MEHRSHKSQLPNNHQHSPQDTSFLPFSKHTRQTPRGVFFDPNPTRHSYAYTGDTNSNDDYERLSGDSISQDTDMNDRISPTGNRDTTGERRNDWQQGRTTGFRNHTTGTTGRSGFPTDQAQFPAEKHSHMLQMRRTRSYPHRMLSIGGVLQLL